MTVPQIPYSLYTPPINAQSFVNRVTECVRSYGINFNDFLNAIYFCFPPSASWLANVANRLKEVRRDYQTWPRDSLLQPTSVIPQVFSDINAVFSQFCLLSVLA